MIDEAVTTMECCLVSPNQGDEAALRNVLLKAQEVNNQYQNQKWGPVRLIQSSDVLLVEQALHCILNPTESGFWAYQMCKDYAERYNPFYPYTLTPESAPLVEDIANFWRRDASAKSLNE